mmetsp:Transcript_25799/g.48080  ORF Transcript_25799/g.48080 Transcript_25799/m.48080 type:complete len:178 (-) Transcript_25799:426-959(-)|eukprot:CAMPEP_0197435546 /NCGR_PEP_ID=MMETSP1175-20131217/3119_1 /TAXON_ID=1003142 /ORGANISM="Triceratium dubium, Strain CCMP147" /LENGTH=177 /DNA_ID=CAMNT_0042964607 /DNA_START=128 /DNA_END=661 /DNA_ORIENTATION=+
MKVSYSLVFALTVINGGITIPSTAEEVGNEGIRIRSLRGGLQHQRDEDRPFWAGYRGVVASKEEFMDIARSLWVFNAGDVKGEQQLMEDAAAGGSSNRAPCPWNDNGTTIPGLGGSRTGMPPSAKKPTAQVIFTPPIETFCESDSECDEGCCADNFLYNCDGDWHLVKACGVPGRCG